MPGESASDYKDVTEAEWAAIEAADAEWVAPTADLLARVQAAANRTDGRDGLRYNPMTGYFECNTLKDLSSADMEQVLAESVPLNGLGTYVYFYARTNIPYLSVGNGVSTSFYNGLNTAPNLEVFRFPQGGAFYMADHMFYSINHAAKLKKILGKWRIDGADANGLGCFNDCPNIEEIEWLKFNFKNNTTFPLRLPKLNLASWQTIVAENVSNGTLALQVHADVYAKVTGDYSNEAAAALTEQERAQWLALGEMATAKNIIFTTA